MLYTKRMRMESKFWSNVDRSGSCWLWLGKKNSGGYGAFYWKGKRHTAHRVSWEIAAAGPVPKSMFICHHCDTRDCVRPDHLYAGTPHQNNMDCLARGRNGWKTHPGENNGRARLTGSDVAQIRYRANTGEHHTVLAREFNVHPTTIFQAVHRLTWKHLP